MARLLFVAADADKDLAIVTRAMATGIKAAPRDSSPGPQRNYLRTSLEKYGPNKWEPYAAPKLDVKDAAGKHVTLDQYRGKNVILVFYLGAECPHCMRQLHDIGKKKDDWERLDTAVLAVSSASPEKNAEALKRLGDAAGPAAFRRRYANARRFHSYDDFEEMELHSTILIERAAACTGRARAASLSADMAFLVKQLERMKRASAGRCAPQAKSDAMAVYNRHGTIRRLWQPAKDEVML